MTTNAAKAWRPASARTLRREIQLATTERQERIDAGDDEIRVGDRVCSGTGDEYDTGIVLGLRPADGMAEVGWDSGTRTWTEIDGLDRTAERWSGGYRMDDAGDGGAS